MSHPEGPRGNGTLKPTSPAVLTISVAVALVIGWLAHRIADAWNGHAPVVTWGQPFVLLVIAVILGGVGWSTYRAVQVNRIPLEPHRAVNRLVLARACAVAGALVAGFYFGYAVSWLGIDVELAHQRLVRSILAGVAGGLITAAALFLEWACRVRDDNPEA